MPNYTVPNVDPRIAAVKNKIGAATHDELERLEAAFIFARGVELRLGAGPDGRFDAEHLKAINRHLFQDVFEWAGYTRNERVRLSDETVATEPIMRKSGGKDFLTGQRIAPALRKIESDLRAAKYLTGLSRADFASRAADLLAALNAIHPFRDGNGRTQRAFVELLARQAGHRLDFAVISRERMTRASIAAHDNDDPRPMRRLFEDASHPARIAALRQATGALAANKFDWNDRYVATTEPGHRIAAIMAGIAGPHFMARTETDILIGTSTSLPQPIPVRGEAFTFEQRDPWPEDGP